MDLKNLITDKLINYCSQMRTIVVCGFAKTGKIIIAKEISKKLNRHLIISDDYKIENREDFKRDVLNFYNRQIPIIVEGILCFNLLRNGVKDNNFYPDLVIKTNCNESTIKYFYEKDGEGDKINNILKFNKSLNTIWEEYISVPSIFKPSFIEIETSLQ